VNPLGHDPPELMLTSDGVKVYLLFRPDNKYKYFTYSTDSYLSESMWWLEIFQALVDPLPQTVASSVFSDFKKTLESFRPIELAAKGRKFREFLRQFILADFLYYQGAKYPERNKGPPNKVLRDYSIAQMDRIELILKEEDDDFRYMYPKGYKTIQIIEKEVKKVSPAPLELIDKERNKILPSTPIPPKGKGIPLPEKKSKVLASTLTAPTSVSTLTVPTSIKTKSPAVAVEDEAPKRPLEDIASLTKEYVSLFEKENDDISSPEEKLILSIVASFEATMSDRRMTNHEKIANGFILYYYFSTKLNYVPACIRRWPKTLLELQVLGSKWYDQIRAILLTTDPPYGEAVEKPLTPQGVEIFHAIQSLKYYLKDLERLGLSGAKTLLPWVISNTLIITSHEKREVSQWYDSEDLPQSQRWDLFDPG